MIPAKCGASMPAVTPAAPFFDQPWVLLSVLLVPLVAAAGQRNPLRLAALALMALALSGPSLQGPGGTVAVLVDVSGSAGQNAVAAAETWAKHNPGADITWYAFAADALRQDGPDAAVPRALDTGLTDVARALQAAAGAGPGRILLVSDGPAS